MLGSAQLSACFPEGGGRGNGLTEVPDGGAHHPLLPELTAQELHDARKLVLRVNLQAAMEACVTHVNHLRSWRKAPEVLHLSRPQAQAGGTHLDLRLLQIGSPAGSSEHNNDCTRREFVRPMLAVQTLASTYAGQRVHCTQTNSMLCTSPLPGRPVSVMQGALLEPTS